jgi:ribose 5-phosphate isomerase
MDLKTISTKELTEELAKREGVQELKVTPYTPLEVTIDGKSTDLDIDSGPAIVLVIYD